MEWYWARLCYNFQVESHIERRRSHRRGICGSSAWVWSIFSRRSWQVSQDGHLERPLCPRPDHRIYWALRWPAEVGPGSLQTPMGRHQLHYAKLNLLRTQEQKHRSDLDNNKQSYCVHIIISNYKKHILAPSNTYTSCPKVVRLEIVWARALTQRYDNK